MKATLQAGAAASAAHEVLKSVKADLDGLVAQLGKFNEKLNQQLDPEARAKTVRDRDELYKEMLAAKSAGTRLVQLHRQLAMLPEAAAVELSAAEMALFVHGRQGVS